MRLYLDDCAYSKALRRLLFEAGFDVEIPEDAGLRGAADPRHFAYVREVGRVLITRNPADFLALHRVQPEHPGILAIYQDNTPRDMQDAEIVQALHNVVRDMPEPLRGAFVVLNHWRY